MAHPILKALHGSEEYRRLSETLRQNGGSLSIYGLLDAHKTHMSAALMSDLERQLIYIAPSEASALRAYDEISKYIEKTYLFPARDISLTAKTYASSGGIQQRRIEALCALLGGESCAVVASAEALIQRLTPPDVINSHRMSFMTGDEYDPNELMERLMYAGYERTDMCESKGQAAVRGGYVDVFPPTCAYPVRIEFFDNEIDTMREFDPLTQRSIRNVNRVDITPSTETPYDMLTLKRAAAQLKGADALSEERELLENGVMPQNSLNLLPFLYDEPYLLTDYAQDGALVVIDEPPRVEESMSVAQMMFAENAGALMSSGQVHSKQTELVMHHQHVIAALDTQRTAMMFSLTRSYNTIKPKSLFNFTVRSVPKYSSGDEALRDDILHWRKNNESVLIYAGAQSRRVAERLADIGIDAAETDDLTRDVVQGELLIVGKSLARGFEYPEIKLVLLTEEELYGTSSYRTTPAKKKRKQLAFTELAVGDLVVHEVHGIGKFTGVEKMEVSGKTRDYLKIQYAAGDALYIPTDQLDRVQKYIGADDEAPKLSRLGSQEWQRTVAKTRESVKKLAFDLLKLYGERASKKGHCFAPDTPWQVMMEESFPYEETPDQLTCIQEIKADMESPKVMDRLLCGDVGYGKTEVALRAAFKAVMDSMQVIFLVPTTILAQQHYNTAVSRFAGFPVTVRLLSRFKTEKEVKLIKEELASGKADMVVGTHMLLSDGIKYKNAGLLIIDEEQRFGVGHKEQIKNLKSNLDVLTLTATPIPRTLHMSMTGIRDMSVIETPPEQRYPVQTYVMEYQPNVVREAILKETGRGGQVYFVYNQVKNMDSFAERLSQLMPEVRITYAHGQMSERMLEKTMLAFMNREYDVLLCSTIIESGLDITNVNTIIVYDADKLGLAQLYQLRGRVGRGSRLAYAYLMFGKSKVLSEVAEKRLSAIREFTQFGSGFKIAMRDLEIRGAGNILGPEQHGFMAAVGYDLYCKLVDRAMREAKGEQIPATFEASVTIPVDANIPETYISSERERLEMYRHIALIADRDDMNDVQDELIDRYGDIPQEVQNLLDISLIKARASKAFIEKLTVAPGEVKFVFADGAPVDSLKLIELSKRIKGARIESAGGTTLTIRQKKVSAEAIKRSLLQIVHALEDCILK